MADESVVDAAAAMAPDMGAAAAGLGEVEGRRDRENDGADRSRSRSPRGPRGGFEGDMQGGMGAGYGGVPMGGGPMGGGGGADVRPGDWTCPNCNANVFASKIACFRCQHPRHGGMGGPRAWAAPWAAWEVAAAAAVTSAPVTGPA